MTLSSDILQLVATRDKPESQLVLRALMEALLLIRTTHPEGTHGAIAELEEALEKKLGVWAGERKAWANISDVCSWRRDGVRVERGWPLDWQQTESQQLEAASVRSFWTVSMPPALGGRSPCFVVEGATLADATLAVDQRWPMATWWRTVDALGQAAQEVHSTPRAGGQS